MNWPAETLGAEYLTTLSKDNVVISTTCRLRLQQEIFRTPWGPFFAEFRRRRVTEEAAARGRATMRDVAALAKVSLKTVSRVVNGERGVSPRLARRVSAASERLDYRHNLTASILRRSDGRSLTIGVVLEDVANPFASTLHRAIEDVAVQRGVLVLAGSSDEDERRERLLVAAFASRRVDGLIIQPSSHDHSYLRSERRAGAAYPARPAGREPMHHQAAAPGTRPVPRP